RVEAMVASGVKKSDAFKMLAEEFGQPVNSVRGLYYVFSKKENGGASKPRRRETTTADAVASAVSALQKALADIDREVEAAKTRAEEAQAEYKALLRVRDFARNRWPLRGRSSLGPVRPTVSG
ncbi:MAG: hypothetical protein ACXVGQ_13175, partial [Mycobacteriaceae bacterium]